MPRAFRVLSGSSLPHRLKDLPQPPVRLYLRGELPRGPAVAIVGTRQPSPEARAFTCELAAALAGQGVAVLSGGASGIDTAAHEGALRERGVTVVVAPAGFERPFPTENRALFQRIVAAGGAYLALAPDRQPATSAVFFERNAALVALAHLLVVTEAPVRSGARNAVRWARRLGRPLLVVPAAPWNPTGRGCLLELRRGARLCEGPKDVIRELGQLNLVAIPPAGAQNQLRLPLDSVAPRAREARPGANSEATALAAAGGEPARARVLSAARSGALHPDQICLLTGLPAAVVQREILTLTLQGDLAPALQGARARVSRGRRDR